jgi:hypothetical protein
VLVRIYIINEQELPLPVTTIVGFNAEPNDSEEFHKDHIVGPALGKLIGEGKISGPLGSIRSVDKYKVEMLDDNK